MTIIEFQNVTFRYESDDEGVVLAPAVKDFSLSINEGEFIAILGHNGSGKSTIAKLSNGLLIPESGDVIVNGMNTKNEDDDINIKQTVGVVFQNPDNQIVATIVEEDVAFAPENLGIPPEEIRKRVDDALKAVGMTEYRNHAPSMLSGGQKQRVAIAGVIAMRPKCIILDEPTAMLDPIGRREVISTIKRLNKESGITIVLITHNMDEAVHADRIILMHKGNIEKTGTPREIFSDVDMMKNIGLDVPQVTEVAHLLHKAGFNIRRDVLTEEELITQIKEIINWKNS